MSISEAEISLKNDCHKRPLLEAHSEESFKKKLYWKKGILGTKIFKKLNVQNDVKSRLRTLNKGLWAIYVFFTNLKFDDCQKHERKPAEI